MIHPENITPELAMGLVAAENRWSEATAIREFAKAIRKPDYSRKATDFQRFWPRVAFASSGCWVWTGFLDELGYGRTGQKTLGEDKAHRFAYRLFKGDIQRGLEVMHSCDLRCCVNPEHLSLGSHQDNIDDMMAKGRHRNGKMTGETNPMARLTWANVAEIRRLKSEGAAQCDLAQQFGVSPMTVSRVIRGETWL